MLNLYTLGMMGMMNQYGNVHQTYHAKYGYGADFRNRPQAITYSTEVLPIPQQNATKKLPASFFSEMAKYYFF